MKKLRIFSIILLLGAVAAFVGFRIYENGIEDRTAPVITCDSDLILVSVSDEEEKFMEGVRAEDDRDGDITSRVVVQDISDFLEDGTREITYAVSDGSGNVGYASRKLQYSDYQAPVFSLSSPLLFALGSQFNVCSGLTASSALDGDLTDKIKFTLDQTISTSVEGTYTVEYRVTDSAGTTTYLETKLEVYDSRLYPIEVRLSDYLIYLDVNDTFLPRTYYEGADQEGVLSVQSQVDTSVPGCYYVDYSVSDGVYSGKSRMIVVVRE